MAKRGVQGLVVQKCSLDSPAVVFRHRSDRITPPRSDVDPLAAKTFSCLPNVFRIDLCITLLRQSDVDTTVFRTA